MNNERIDFIESKISKHRDKNGFITLEARPTRTGVLKYNFNGKEVRELRHPDDVFNKDSMDSLKMKPFSLQHNGGLLNPESASRHMKGATGEDIRQDGDYLTCKIAIFDKEAMKDIEGGKALMLSAGYTCDPIEESGEYKGERYDRRQTNIRYNHVSGVEKGRAGEACQLRLDSSSAVLISGIEPIKTKEDRSMGKLKLEKVEFNDVRLDSIQVEESDGVKALLDQRDVLIGKLKDSHSENSKKDGRLDALKVELEAANETSKNMVSAERLDALVEERAKIIDIASASGFELSKEGTFEEVSKKAKIGMLKDAGFKESRLDSEGAYLDAAWDQWTSNADQLKLTLKSKMNLNNNSSTAEYSNVNFLNKPL